MSALLSLYHRLPYPARVLAASARGYRLRRWRYGPRTDAWAQEAAAREQWGADRWHAWTRERLLPILERASRRVPAYRAWWQSRPTGAWRELSNWPLLSKETLRSDPRAFLAHDRDPRRMYSLATSGSTGTPLRLWWPRETVRRWYALCERRLRGWNGVGRETRWAILGGQLVVPFRRTRPPFWVWNAGLRQLYLSAYHVSPANAAAMIAALRKHRVRYLLGYPSALTALAQAALEQDVEAPRLEVVLANAEPLLGFQRAALARLFRCPVRDSYGMAEIVAGASECDAGSLHLWPEAGILEVLRDDSDDPATPGSIGRLACTGLLNPDMPLVRYLVGDRGAIDPSDEPCACGRRLPRLRTIDGRDDDVVVTPDGRRVGRLDPVFKTGLPVREAQVVQENRETIRVRVVPAPGFDAREERRMVDRFRERLGDMRYEVERVEVIERGPNGKFRAVVSHLPREG